MAPDMWVLDRLAKADADRDHWEFVPFEHVGPLTFGMTPDETVTTLGIAAGSRLSGPASERRLVLYDAGINVYFDEGFGLACVAVDAFDGPQVVAPDGFALVGRVPSQVRPPSNYLTPSTTFAGPFLRESKAWPTRSNPPHCSYQSQQCQPAFASDTRVC